MGSEPARLRDIAHGRAPSRLRLLAPLRYLFISHPEKKRYDIYFPIVMASVAWLTYSFVVPSLKIFGDASVLGSLKDLLVMAVPFLIGALAAVAMGGPGHHMDRRPPGAPLVLEGRILTLRQFVCYLLGYLSFLSFITLLGDIGSVIFRPYVLLLCGDNYNLMITIRSFGTACLFLMISSLVITTLYALYFLTDIVNRTE